MRLDSRPDGWQLATTRLHMRPLQAVDAADLVAITDRPGIAGVIPFLPAPFTIADAERLIAWSDGDGDLLLGVREDGAPGLAAVVGVHLRGVDAVEIGYWVDPDRQGWGLASEAAAAVLAAVRSMLPGRIAVAECRPDNHASRRILEKLGFRPTGAPGERPGRDLFTLDDDRPVRGGTEAAAPC